MKNPINKLSKEITIEDALQILNRNNSKMIMVVNENDRLEGVVYRSKLFEYPEEYRKSVKLESIMIKEPLFAYTSDSLHQALVRLSSNDLQEMPVLSNEDHKVIGIVTILDLVRLYDAEVEKIKKQRNQSDLSVGASSNEVDNKGSRNTDDSTKKSPI
jgi:signal-transduction protein with cAMP-binding, CBS, and nucleotidyltransferase domain